MELLDYKLTQVQQELGCLVSEIKENLINRSEFNLRVGRLETILYSLIGLLCTGVVLAILSTVLK